MGLLRAWLRNIIYAGHGDEESADVRKQILISSFFSLISCVFLILFAIDDFGNGNSQLAAVVLITAVASGANYLFLYRTGNYQVSSVVVVCIMALLCLYLLSTGGQYNTGPLWMFVLPGIIFYILGFTRGIICLCTLLLIICYMLFVPDNALLRTVYIWAFTKRFMAALFSVSVVAAIYEYTREDGRRELINLSRKLDYLSRKDDLTGLSNRRDMFERLRTEIDRVERSGRVFSVAIADVDRFKDINDTYGHECGDLFLQEIARVLDENTQKRDRVARWGGEEFLIFLPETTGGKAAVTAERLRKAVEEIELEYEGEKRRTTVSLGVAEYIQGKSLNRLINRADKQLYLAKRSGRNRVEQDDTGA